MSKRKKPGKALDAMVSWHFGVPAHVEWSRQAQTELRALLSVARYARTWAATDPYPSRTDVRLNDLHRALLRLDKASAPPAAPKEEEAP